MLIARCLTFVLVGAFYCLGQSGSQQQFASRDKPYQIEVSDVVEITFDFTPEYNQLVTVQPDGCISLRSVGQIKIAGLTLKEATQAITEKYASSLHDPVITLTLKEFMKPAFVIGGEIARPGRYDLHGTATLTDAVAIAGGFTPAANSASVLLFRRVSRQTVEVKKVDVKHMLSKATLTEDPVLQPGDSIYVSKSLVGKIDRFMQVSRLGLYFPIPTIP